MTPLPRIIDCAHATDDGRPAGKYTEIRSEAKGRDHEAREARLATSEDHGVIPITGEDHWEHIC